MAMATIEVPAKWIRLKASARAPQDQLNQCPIGPRATLVPRRRSKYEFTLLAVK